MQMQGIHQRYGAVHALQDTSLTIHHHELLAVAGASGAGKSTLLRVLAGVEPPDSGTMEVYPRDRHQHLPVLVFQDYLLFPHMTVRENVAFGLRAQRRRFRLCRREIHHKVDQCLDALQLAHRGDHWPAHLSGGEQQRAALARALVLEPTLLLLDEPLASLDRSLKRETADYIRQLHLQFQVTTVVVSHDIETVVSIADRLAVLCDGAVAQIDHPARVLAAPATPAVARLVAGVEPCGC